MLTSAHLSIFIGGIATLAIFSFLIRENPVYRTFEHVFIGLAAGLGFIQGITQFFWPIVIVPILGLDIVQYPDGTFSKSYEPLLLLYLFPVSFGLLYYCVLFERYAWLAQLVIGFQLGSAGAFSIKGTFNEMLPQVFSSFKPLLTWTAGGEFDWYTSISNSVFVYTLLAVMYYFFFSIKRESKVSQTVASSGRWLMMICFGAFFGSTVMARMALLVERLNFLYNDWVPLFFGVIS